VISGGKDGIVCIMNHKLEIQKKFEEFGTFNKLIRSVCPSNDETTLLIGTYGSEVIEMAMTTS